MHKYADDADFKGFDIQGDYIYKIYWTKDKEIVGVVKDFYNACNDERQQYYDRLVELGDIVPEPTPEIIAKQQNDKLDKILGMLTNQDERLQKVEKAVAEKPSKL